MEAGGIETRVALPAAGGLGRTTGLDIEATMGVTDWVNPAAGDRNSSGNVLYIYTVILARPCCSPWTCLRPRHVPPPRKTSLHAQHQGLGQPQQLLQRYRPG